MNDRRSKKVNKGHVLHRNIIRQFSWITFHFLSVFIKPRMAAYHSMNCRLCWVCYQIVKSPQSPRRPQNVLASKNSNNSSGIHLDFELKYEESYRPRFLLDRYVSCKWWLESKISCFFIFFHSPDEVSCSPRVCKRSKKWSLWLVGADVTQSQYLISPSQPQVTTLDVSWGCHRQLIQTASCALNLLRENKRVITWVARAENNVRHLSNFGHGTDLPA